MSSNANNVLFPVPCTPLNTVLRKALVVAVAVLFSDTDGGLQIFYGIGVVVSGSVLTTLPLMPVVSTLTLTLYILALSVLF